MPVRLASAVRSRAVPISLVLSIVVGLPVWTSRPAPVAASTESSMAGTILTRINRDRAAHGLIALRTDTRLINLAVNRAQWMAATGDMSHTSYGGAVYDAVAMVGVNAYASAEAVGATNATLGTPAADYLYSMWQGSPEHWQFLMSTTFNYIGIGVAYQGATATSYASLVFAEAPDSSRPVVKLTGYGHSGTTAFWTWSGYDGQLQSHTAGLRDFDVQYRVDNGPWKTILSHTTSTQLLLKNRARGHSYAVRVRDRDRRNNLSGWSTIRTVRI
jgi:uncharacterized protein YkwD